VYPGLSGRSPSEVNSIIRNAEPMLLRSNDLFIDNSNIPIPSQPMNSQKSQYH